MSAPGRLPKFANVRFLEIRSRLALPERAAVVRLRPDVPYQRWVGTRAPVRQVYACARCLKSRLSTGGLLTAERCSGDAATQLAVQEFVAGICRSIIYIGEKAMN